MLAFFLSLPIHLLSQEETGEKKVRVKTIREADGKKIVTDTTFVVSGEQDVQKVVDELTRDAETDSAADMRMNVMVDVEGDVDWDAESGKRVIVIRKGAEGGREMPRKKVIIIDDEGNEEVIVVPRQPRKSMEFWSDDGEEYIFVDPRYAHHGHRVIKWRGEGGEDYVFDFDMKDLQKDMFDLQEDMKEMQIRIMDERGNASERVIEMEELKALKDLEHLEQLEQLKEMEVIVVPSAPAPEFFEPVRWHHDRDMEVADRELREAGIKNKPDRLELDEIDIEKENGIVDLSFALREEGSPKVNVYNIYGDKVYSGKPELMNDKYELKIDLSKKQHGTYYLMIVSGNSSKTLRLKN